MLAQSKRNGQQSSRASEKEKGEGAVAVTVSTLSLLGAESADRADVGPEYEVGRTAAPARGQDAVAELAESIRLFLGMVFCHGTNRLQDLNTWNRVYCKRRQPGTHRTDNRLRTQRC